MNQKRAMDICSVRLFNEVKVCAFGRSLHKKSAKHKRIHLFLTTHKQKM